MLLDDGNTSTVRVNQYRLNHANYKAAANDAFMTTLKNRRIDRELSIETETGTVLYLVDPGLDRKEDAFKKRTGIDAVMTETSSSGQKIKVDSHITDWGALAHYTYLGKGSPEHCQIVLQLAHHFDGPDPERTNGPFLSENLSTLFSCDRFIGQLFKSQN